MSSDNLRSTLDSPVLRIAGYLIVVLIGAVQSIVVSQYRSSMDGLAQGMAQLRDQINTYNTNQATMMLRLQSLESASTAQSKSIDSLRDQSQENAFQVDRLQEILKVQAINTRPSR